MHREDLLEYLNDYLKTGEFQDMCPNGLQVEGRSEINRIITGVTASVELFNRAVLEKADAVIVHHGIIWDFQRPVYKGSYRERIRILLENDINLLAYHLPLDAHPECGNNIQIARKLGLQNIQPFGDYKGQSIGYKGRISAMNKEDLFRRVEELVDRKPVIYPFGPDPVRTIGVVSGGAQKEITQAVSEGLDVYVTGEVSEHIMHYAQEERIHFISAGHYATERFGIRALGDQLQNDVNLTVTFIDIPNPV